MIDDAVGEDLGAGAEPRIADDAIGADLHAGGELHAAAQDGVDVDEHVAPDLDVAADVDARGIRQGGAGEHQFVSALAPVQASTWASWILVVDAHDFRRRVPCEPPRRDRPNLPRPRPRR
jgi:hypothetical protein